MSEPRILTINHGQSENILVSWVGNRLNMGIEQHSNNKGRNAIRIEMLPELFARAWFKDEASLHRKFTNLEYFPKALEKMPGLAIFPIMDTENETHPDRSYMTGAMFDGNHFREQIHPIYNIPNLDAVIEKAGLGTVSKDKPSSYSNMLDDLEVQDMYDALKGRNDTNLQDFLQYCLKTRPWNQGKNL